MPPETNEIILCTEVFDVMLLSQEKLVALSFPKGNCRLPQYELPRLEPFKRITLWFDNDVHSWQQAKLFALKLNDKRCSFIRPKADQPSPTKAFPKHSLKGILKTREPIKHESIATFNQLREEVFEEFRQADQVKGLKWKRFPKLTKILQGHRRGELTILTGPTGCGKTTFVSEYALDLAMQGTSTLWGSFEISNVRLLKTTLTQVLYKIQFMQQLVAVCRFFMKHGDHPQICKSILSPYERKRDVERNTTVKKPRYELSDSTYNIR